MGQLSRHQMVQLSELSQDNNLKVSNCQNSSLELVIVNDVSLSRFMTKMQSITMACSPSIRGTLGPSDRLR